LTKSAQKQYINKCFYNLLAEKFEAKMSECVFIILGATGDLTKRKLIPAIYNLVENKKLDNFAIIGTANSDVPIERILEGAKEFIPHFNPQIWEKIYQVSYYQQLDFYNKAGYPKLKELIETVEKKHNIYGKRIFYLATLPEHFEIITKNLAQQKIVTKPQDEKECENKQNTWSKIVYEKPFGNNLKSAKKINRCVNKLFHEKQIYRIDHFLGKELVSNIAIFRFTNRVLEPIWNKENIDSVQIILNEKIGAERASFDHYGTLKDVFQNHILQILALISMEAPEKIEAEPIRDAKAKVLKKVKIDSVILGQYEGYREEKNINPNSNTETFAAIKLFVNNKRWAGIPFYIKTGKCLDKKDTSVHIKFKMVDCLLTTSCPTDSNYLTIKIEPEDGFYLELNTKKPGSISQIVPVQMNFCHSCIFGPNTPAAYETLLYDVIIGDQSAFVREDEIETSWKIVEQIKKDTLQIYNYKKGSSGPEEIKRLDKEKEIKWRA
jgi:glucose-6-phosphate 1-dehydrogenase